MSDIHSCSYYCDRPACIKAQRDELRDRFQVMQAQAEVDDKAQRIAALQGGEPVVFTCHGNNAPAYGCNKPGDMSGTYYKAPQPVVDVFDSLISPAILSFAKGEDELLVRRIWDKVRVALLSVGKGGV